ncbi:glycogen/starch/alpha-glucan phosphorylase [Fervidobacterium gondwanense]|uniref:Alpha-1,4 glucan phosphorylase n=1 Tax=Fervidobacterium gondwanense DSM 13020 TaxID=1121883 RepID=A0A1M7TIP8_FERGO|nr:glycogen/starch/alpha-glucan phosphorylase [Fervidobacterium gondwanense]SHN70513.1 glycogen phosphorylase [Fervidobacterium gondwanense DSM 13020]
MSKSISKVNSNNKKDFVENQFEYHLKHTLAETPEYSSIMQKFFALSNTVRDIIAERWLQTEEKILKRRELRIVNYLSMEFLIGRLLYNNILNLQVEDEIKELLSRYDLTLDEIALLEEDAALGNGGLGRLAACFLDSLATLGYLSYGYTIRYQYGLFKQEIENGFQREVPDDWMKNGYPWEFPKPEESVKVKFFGRSEAYTDEKGRLRFRWVDTYDVLAVPYDIYVTGYDSDIVLVLRLWQPKALNEFNFAEFEKGNYEKAVYEKNLAETLCKVLYPNDAFFQGRELRLKQEYFFVSAAIQDIIRRHKRRYRNDLYNLSSAEVIQLNDTHPTLAIPELMRILLDEEGYTWEEAWEIVKNTIAYTNHTVMPEALEKWEAPLFQNMLPRHYQIIEEINARFLNEVAYKFDGDLHKIINMSVFEEGNIKKLRMANLCSIASFSINGVSELHTEILKKTVLKDFYEMYPEKFNNKTNGVTQRRWLLECNPPLAKLIKESIGDGWITDLYELKKLEIFQDDPEFLEKLDKAKMWNKERLAKYVKEKLDIVIDPNTLFDIQVKRIHEYKRQLLNILHVIHLYNEIRAGKHLKVPRTFIFAGKSAPGYRMAKLIIKLINSVANVVNNDPIVSKELKVVFIPNYNVSAAQIIIPAANISEQISTAGTEASGTGNMKFMINGALTIGTLDGANVEMLEEVGEDNILIFGLKAEEIEEAKRKGKYNPFGIYLENEKIRKVLDMVRTGYFTPETPELFEDIFETLIYGKHAPMPDQYFVLADFDAYAQAHKKIEELFLNKQEWNRKSLLNIARSGKFSSDRTIEEYVRDIWKTQKV